MLGVHPAHLLKMVGYDCILSLDYLQLHELLRYKFLLFLPLRLLLTLFLLLFLFFFLFFLQFPFAFFFLLHSRSSSFFNKPLIFLWIFLADCVTGCFWQIWTLGCLLSIQAFCILDVSVGSEALPIFTYFFRGIWQNSFLVEASL